ncbi:GNAT family N-acetyltransferase [Rothia uropygialis]|uniref:GNAT family N-acetyltransferase n=1 Tax=Kocuria sp. 36 TaxID=1415402 RepID=UPI00101BA7D8|nr:GNAT family protein [Kocuria sp. 36]
MTEFDTIPTPPTDLGAPTLTGTSVQLEQLSLDHCKDLQEATRDGELWNLWYTSVPRPEGIESEIHRRLELQRNKAMIPFAARRLADGKITGMTSYYDLDWSAPRVDIGYTWNAASTQRTGMNIESKKLLLTYAFETLKCISVRFETHKLNRQSRRAIEGLGAQLDGVLRNDRRMEDGSIRDTCSYSIVRDEWPAVRNHLAHRLNRAQDR